MTHCCIAVSRGSLCRAYRFTEGSATELMVNPDERVKQHSQPHCHTFHTRFHNPIQWSTLQVHAAACNNDVKMLEKLAKDASSFTRHAACIQYTAYTCIHHHTIVSPDSEYLGQRTFGSVCKDGVDFNEPRPQALHHTAMDVHFMDHYGHCGSIGNRPPCQDGYYALDSCAWLQP